MAFDNSEYVDVATRVQQFYEKFPEGRLTRYKDPQLWQVGEEHFIVFTAAAYRDASDPHPGVGTSWEPVPGRTNFTRDSEIQNAETAAWGRAIAACGFTTKHIASADEVKARHNGLPAVGSKISPDVAVLEDGVHSLKILTHERLRAKADWVLTELKVMTVDGKKLNGPVKTFKDPEMFPAGTVCQVVLKRQESPQYGISYLAEGIVGEPLEGSDVTPPEFLEELVAAGMTAGVVEGSDDIPF